MQWYQRIETKACANCGKTYTGTVRTKFCSKSCGYASRRKTQTETGPNPSGMCMCGCGQKTKLARQTLRRTGDIKGTPLRYVRGHNLPRGNAYWIEEDRGYTTPCHIWQGGKSNGYGVLNSHKSGRHVVHVQRWMEVHGPVPDGLSLHHECHQRDCVNPEHLTPMTRKDHNRLHRTEAMSGKGRRKARR